MKATIIKEFRQLRRDRRTLAMMIFLPVLLLVILGYAASFDVSHIQTVVSGPDARQVAVALPRRSRSPAPSRAQAQTQLRDGHAAMAVVTGGPQVVIYLDGSQIFTAQAANRRWPRKRHAPGPGRGERPRALQPGAEDLETSPSPASPG